MPSARPDLGACWLWTGKPNRYGYGRFCNAAGVMVLAHRYAYELDVGPIPEGLTLDHLCRVHACVRPSHLEPVTNAENVRRRHQAQAAATGATAPQHPHFPGQTPCGCHS